MGFLEGLANQILPSHPDPRTDAYPLMTSFPPTALISLAYVVGVYAWRNELLRRSTIRKQKSIANGVACSKPKTADQWGFVKTLMVLYNVVMVLYSAYIVLGTLQIVFELNYGLRCEKKPEPSDSATDRMLYFGYLFYFSKFVEMLDTVFFLWRGKVDQVTFLHVFHHASMPPSIWWGVRYAPGGVVYMFPLANSLIHVIMYTYYGMAAAGLYKYLWWKNYLTIAQMIQFVVLMVHQGQFVTGLTPCDYPKVFPAAIVFYATVFLVLFGNFYIQAYWRKQRLAKSASTTSVKTESIANGHVLANGTGPKSYGSGERDFTDESQVYARKKRDH